MRTTLNLDDEILSVLRSLSQDRGVSMGDVATDLIREALRADSGGAYRGDFPVFTVREGAPALTSDMVAEALDES